MKRIALSTILIAACTSAYAETPQPAIVSNVQETAQDSPLVLAAKRSLARRQKTGASATPVITNATVANSRGVLSTSSGGATVAGYAATGSAPAAAAVSPQRASYSPAITPGEAMYAVKPMPSDPRLPQAAQNALSASAPGMAQNAGYSATTPRTVQNASGAPQQSSTAVSLPREVTNSAYSPATAKNTEPINQKP